ncbi:hypothetical protein [Rhodococcus sp. T7]|uniref:hypothetical protein n=1 Tax=Rhodococcus sp. T7 TaxID=627444 RepID=UPI00135C9734|nr:hypothetical protein [Rhodococcus sp. T7]KAF0959640.1 hypothetical protein MLGJGCBP_07235 [Rhodococcus sp. T7]
MKTPVTLVLALFAATLLLFQPSATPSAIAQPHINGLTSTEQSADSSAATVSALPATDAALPPGDTVELRTGVGAAIGGVIGGIAGLPFFVIGAVPGAIIGAVIGGAIGYASHGIATSYMG